VTDDFEGKVYPIGAGKKQWRRATLMTPDGETKVRFAQTSTDTLSIVKLEGPSIVDQIKLAGNSARVYIKLHGTELAQEPDAAIRKLTLFLREKHPALDGRDGSYILSDAGFKELIDRAWDGQKCASGKIYDSENERAAKMDNHGLTAETSKTYRKKSKPSTRQKKQSKPGRPRNNSA